MTLKMNIELFRRVHQIQSLAVLVALGPRYRGAALGGWLGQNPISMATHISLPVFKLRETKPNLKCKSE